MTEQCSVKAVLTPLFLKQVPKVAATCDFDAIMDGYYRFLFPLNPGNIKPAMPSALTRDALFEPHGRERLSSQSRTLVNS